MTEEHAVNVGCSLNDSGGCINSSCGVKNASLTDFVWKRTLSMTSSEPDATEVRIDCGFTDTNVLLYLKNPDRNCESIW